MLACSFFLTVEKNENSTQKNYTDSKNVQNFWSSKDEGMQQCMIQLHAIQMVLEKVL